MTGAERKRNTTDNATPIASEQPAERVEAHRPVEAVPRLAWTCEEAARSVGVCEATFRDWVRQGHVAVVRVGSGRLKRRFLVRPEDIAEFLRRRREAARGEAGS